MFGWCIALAVLVLFAWCESIARRLRRLSELCVYDSKTGLLSGHVFEGEAWPSALREQRPLALLFLDLDGLKERNARLGHRAGDEYLQRAAKALLRRRGTDQTFRLHSAGDEFAILVLGDSAAKAADFAAVLCGDLLQLGISASIGVAWTNSNDHLSRAAVYERSERAMRSAKQRKGCVVVANDN